MEDQSRRVIPAASEHPASASELVVGKINVSLMARVIFHYVQFARELLRRRRERFQRRTNRDGENAERRTIKRNSGLARLKSPRYVASPSIPLVTPKMYRWRVGTRSTRQTIYELYQLKDTTATLFFRSLVKIPKKVLSLRKCRCNLDNRF